MDRRGFLFLTGGLATGLVIGAEFIALPGQMVIAMGGGCSFCARHASKTDALASIVGRKSRVCPDCIALVLRADYSRPAPFDPYRDLLDRGDLDGATRALIAEVEKSPNDIRVRLRLADVLAKNRDDLAAAREYELVAETYRREGFLLKATAVTKQIEKLDGGSAATLFRLGDLYTQLGLFTDAAQMLKRAFTMTADAATLGILARAVSAPGTPNDEEHWIALRQGTAARSEILPDGCSFCSGSTDLFKTSAASICRTCATAASGLLTSARDRRLLS